MVPLSTNLGLSILLLVSTFHFCLSWTNIKIKALETVFQRSIKTTFFVYEELMKNDILFSKVKIRCALEMGTRGRGSIYGVSFHKEVFRNNCVGFVTGWGLVVERPGTSTAPPIKDNWYTPLVKIGIITGTSPKIFHFILMGWSTVSPFYDNF